MSSSNSSSSLYSIIDFAIAMRDDSFMSSSNSSSTKCPSSTSHSSSMMEASNMTLLFSSFVVVMFPWKICLLGNLQSRAKCSFLSQLAFITLFSAIHLSSLPIVFCSTLSSP
ncbi:hypothetical protein V6N11_055533 [Hibiscus sabdariffa]|uniref:Uncharacterized protein n=1 Tax=Hibiscus sabdariffa TaxID=183260 RepID=A0ABR2NQV3_9ROSI